VDCLHKYTKSYAEMVRPLSQLLKKEAEWMQEHRDAFDAVKKSLASISWESSCP